MENSRPTWDIRLMSYNLDPEPGAKLKAVAVTVRGVAYNDGSAPTRSGRGPLTLLAAANRSTSHEAHCPG